jgi:hypothetical protein
VRQMSRSEVIASFHRLIARALYPLVIRPRYDLLSIIVEGAQTA